MKKREFFLFISFVALFVLFAVFQNFSFPVKQLQQIANKEFYEGKIQKFVPSYIFKNYLDENGEVEAPYGYQEEVSRRIASLGAPVVFDERKFLKDGIKTMPVYKSLRDIIDMSDDTATSADAEPTCIENPIEPQNNCHADYAPSNHGSASSVKVRANPFRQTASVSVPGDIRSQMLYDADRNAVNVQFKKDLDKDAGLKLELDSEQKSGSINIDVRW